MTKVENSIPETTIHVLENTILENTTNRNKKKRNTSDKCLQKIHTDTKHLTIHRFFLQKKSFAYTAFF